jgi:hypothetical protein
MSDFALALPVRAGSPWWGGAGAVGDRGNAGVGGQVWGAGEAEAPPICLGLIDQRQNGLNRGSVAVHRDVPAGGRGERLTVPAGPAIVQP